MSHYTCYVVLKDCDGVEDGDKALAEKLEPFNECSEKYQKWNDLSKEYKDEYEGIPVMSYNNKLEIKKLKAIVETATGRVLGCIYDKEIPEIKAMYVKKEAFGDDELVLAKGFEQKSLLVKEIYSTFEDYVSIYHQDEEMGYNSNPNAKWDWYQIGGRWSGQFMNKNTKEMQDVIQKKDIDVDGMINKLREERIELWERHWLTSNVNLEGYMSWNQLREEKAQELGLKVDEIPHEVYPELRNRRNYIAESSGAASLSKKMGMHFKDPVEFFCFGDFDKYTDETELFYSALISHSILKDGKWYEDGEMGWFGMSGEGDFDFRENWKKIFDSINQDDWIVNVDCHI